MSKLMIYTVVKNFFYGVLMVVTLVSCNKYSLHNSIINYSRSNADLTAKYSPTNNGTITYLENETFADDTRETLVLLHGFGSDKDIWNEYAKLFSRHYHLIIPDLPGHGHSFQNMALNYSIDSQAKYLHDFLQKLNAKKIHLIGNSMGGAICIRYAYLFPESIKSLVLINSHGAVKTPSYVDLLYKETGELPMLDINNVEDFKRTLALATEKSRYIPDFMLQVLTEQKIARKQIEKKLLADMMKDINQLDFLPDIKTPVLILWGEQDKILHVDNADLLHQRLKNSKKVVLKNIGHIPQYEDPRRTAEITKLFYSRFERNEIAAN